MIDAVTRTVDLATARVRRFHPPPTVGALARSAHRAAQRNPASAGGLQPLAGDVPDYWPLSSGGASGLDRDSLCWRR